MSFLLSKKGGEFMDSLKVKKALESAEAKAKELGVDISIAIVDQYGDLVAFSRMNRALKISPRFAIAKAYTSGTLGLATTDIAKYSGEGKPYYGVESLFGGVLTTIAGGLPIMEGEKIIGGIGVGGSHDVNQDVECAKSALGELA